MLLTLRFAKNLDHTPPKRPTVPLRAADHTLAPVVCSSSQNPCSHSHPCSFHLLILATPCSHPSRDSRTSPWMSLHSRASASLVHNPPHDQPQAHFALRPSAAFACRRTLVCVCVLCVCPVCARVVRMLFNNPPLPRSPTISPHTRLPTLVVDALINGNPESSSFDAPATILTDIENLDVPSLSLRYLRAFDAMRVRTC
jgi:hypothetical protein